MIPGQGPPIEQEIHLTAEQAQIIVPGAEGGADIDEIPPPRIQPVAPGLIEKARLGRAPSLGQWRRLAESDPHALEPCAPARFRDRHVATKRIVNPGGDRPAAPELRHHHGEFRPAGGEIGGAVQRINHEDRAFIRETVENRGIGMGRLLADHGAAGHQAGQPLGQAVLGGAIGDGDDIARRLLLDLVIRQMAEARQEFRLRHVADEASDLFQHVRHLQISNAMSLQGWNPARNTVLIGQVQLLRGTRIMARNLPHVGLALGSGVARGFAHIGVLRALEARGVRPDVIAGTSIGAVVGAAYAAGKLDMFEDWAHSLARRKFWRYLDPRMSGGSLFGGQRLSDQLLQHLADVDIGGLSCPFIAVATDLVSGHEIWLREGPVVDAVRASYALPGIFPPVERQGRWLVDGALVNPVPISVCRAMEARIVIAVNLNADSFGRARVQSPAPEADDILQDIEAAEAEAEAADPARPRLRWLPVPRPRGKGKVKTPPRRDTPGIMSVVASAFDIVQDRLTRSRLAGEPPDVTIAPRLNSYGFMDFDRAEDMISLGAAAVERAWPDLDEALGGLM